MQYELIRSDRRTAALEIREGKLIVRAPRRMPQAQIEAFIQKNQAWIDARLARSRRCRRSRSSPRTKSAIWRGRPRG